MQNSLERLFAGLAQTLREVVRPAVADPYARAQVSAAAELVENLATRVEWRSELTAADVERMRPVLERAAALGGDELPLARVALGSGQHDDCLAALAEVIVWLAGCESTPELVALDSDVRALLAARLDAEREQMRSGMYRQR